MQRIQSLDGLRAVSVLLVIFGHLSLMFPTHALYGQWAVVGVRVFFVISGLLITSLLSRELQQTGTISLRNFYIRRVLRIFPLAYAFVLVAVALYRFGVIETDRSELWLAATYLMSYKIGPFNALSHLWSLSVEEQFYLIWPAVFLFSGKRARDVCLGVIIASPFVRLAWWYFLPEMRMGIGRAFPTVMDSIAFGCFAALEPAFVQRVSRLSAPAILAGPVAAWALLTFPGDLPPGVPRAAIRFCSDSIIGLGVASFVVWCVANKGSLINFLNLKPMVYIGTISYSLYVWQQLFVDQGHPTLLSTFVALVWIFVVSIAAHYMIERPFLKLKEKFVVKVPTPADALAASSAG